MGIAGLVNAVVGERYNDGSVDDGGGDNKNTVQFGRFAISLAIKEVVHEEQGDRKRRRRRLYKSAGAYYNVRLCVRREVIKYLLN
jgi:hypothetical protein